MTNIKARVTQQGNTLKSVVTPQQNIQVTEYTVSSSNLRLADLKDVDLSAASDGAVLIYNGNTVSFEATTTLENNNTQVNGGHY